MSDYERVFNSDNISWMSDFDINLIFLRTQEDWFNDLLRVRGHVFLNEVYSGLGFSHTPAGAVIGWSLSGNGDGHIEFILDPDNDSRTNNIHIDFNVDGFILDKLGKGVNR